jgi:two-component system, LytTR family, response regulator
MQIKNILECIIVEDEEHSRNFLKGLLSSYFKEIIIIEEVITVNEAIISIEQNKPDLVFLDIELAGESGFTILEHFGENIFFEVIFVTAFQEYAIKAFKYAAVSYLLKPILLDELKDSIERVKYNINKNDSQKQYNFLLEILKKQQKDQNHIALPTSDGFVFIEVDDIVRLEADGAYTTVILKSYESIVVSKNIIHFEELFINNGIIRINRSEMVNIKYIKRYFNKDGGSIVLYDGTKLAVSIRKQKLFQDLIQKI